MSDTAGNGGVKSPGIGEKLSFSLPAILVALVLSIGISYAILNVVNSNTRKDLNDALKEQNDRLTNSIGELQKKHDLLEKDHTALVAKAKQIEDDKNQLAAALKATNESYTGFRAEYSKFVDAQKDVDKGQNQDIQVTSTNLKKVEDRVHYIDEKLKKLDEVAQDVLTLKTDNAGLKEEYKVLRTDLTAVKTKADVTEKDLTDLAERARLFQLRVLAARAREAADAARKTDLKNLLSRLEDVEDGK